MKKLKPLLLSALLAVGGLGLLGADTSSTPPSAMQPPPAVTTVAKSSSSSSSQTVKPAKDPVKQLRGKLLYERSRIRKLEKEAVAADPELAKQIKEMDAKREELYTAAQPALIERYANEKALIAQIDEMTGKK